jgi:hypothetical protein
MAGNCTNFTKIDMMRINFKQVVKKGCVNMKKNQHITQREDGKWQVKGEGNEGHINGCCNTGFYCYLVILL